MVFGGRILVLCVWRSSLLVGKIPATLEYGHQSGPQRLPQILRVLPQMIVSFII